VRLFKLVPSGASNSAHEPQKVVVDYQALTHFEVHGRNARNKVPGKSHFDGRSAAVQSA
jgi:hypothetical protein